MDYVTFCDQDDVWLPQKLTAALQVIAITQSIYVPFVCCGCTTYITDDLKTYDISPLLVFPASFRNALVQSIVGRNAMVFNLAAKLLIEKAELLNAPSNDWRAYLLISGAGGGCLLRPIAL